MHNYYPILWVGAIIGVISTLLIVAAFVVKVENWSLPLTNTRWLPAIWEPRI